jgi:Flp pilus assembly protein TadD
MLRTTRTAHIIDDRFSTLRAMGFAVASAALIAATTACGGEIKSVKDVAVDSSAPSVTPVTVSDTKDSSGSVVSSSTGVVAPVVLTEAESVYRDKRYSDAAALFSTYVEQHPTNPWGHYMLGLSSWKAGDLDRAESAFVRSLELDPKHVKTLLNLARVNLDQGNPKDALSRVTTAIKLDSTSGEGYRLMGRVRAALNEPNEAIAAYRVALSRDPNDVWAMNNMGLLMIQQGRNEEALGPLARAVQVDSTVAVFQNNLGIALEHTGRFALAGQSYKAAIAVDGGYTKAKLSLARVEGRKEDPSVTPVELATLAEAFDREVRGVQMGGPIPKN